MLRIASSWPAICNRCGQSERSFPKPSTSTLRFIAGTPQQLTTAYPSCTNHFVDLSVTINWAKWACYRRWYPEQGNPCLYWCHHYFPSVVLFHWILWYEFERYCNLTEGWEVVLGSLWDDFSCNLCSSYTVRCQASIEDNELKASCNITDHSVSLNTEKWWNR